MSEGVRDRGPRAHASDGRTQLGQVRHAVRADLDPLAAVLADAFADDPLMAWVYGDRATRPVHLRAFMQRVLEIGFPHGHVYTTQPRTAAAIWAPPDVELFDDPAVTSLFGLLGAQLGPRAEEVGAGLVSVAQHHPHDVPHFYLFLLGTAPSVRGRGVGSRMLREVLDRCDQQGLGAYLESSSLQNVPLYARHGFATLAEVPLGEECVVRPMWRDPRS